MNLVADSPAWLIVGLLLAVAAAAIEDAVRLRISNLTCLIVLLAALVAMALQGFPPALWRNAVVFAAILAIGTPLFAAGKMGGGDIKLLACLGLWMNIAAALWLLASTLIAGGIIAIAFIVFRTLRRQERSSGRRVRTGRIPYGLAIAAGAGLIFAGQLGLVKPKPQRPALYTLPSPG